MDAILKAEEISLPWLPRAIWRGNGIDNELLPKGWDDFEGTEALARDIVKETRH